MNPGQSYSTSPNCCIIKFVGGPWDGKSGLYDHHNFQSIQVCKSEERKTYSYTPSVWHLKTFVLTKIHEWSD